MMSNNIFDQNQTIIVNMVIQAMPLFFSHREQPPHPNPPPTKKSCPDFILLSFSPQIKRVLAHEMCGVT
jgi:hypothetical protein